MTSNVKEPVSGANSPFWSMAFRPFFLLGCLFAIAVLGLWVWSLRFGSGTLPATIDWHAHEMIHGFVVAIVTGFLLTASQNWSGVRGVHGWRLTLLAFVWLLGRIAFVWPNTNSWVLAGIDLAFLPLVILFLAPSIWQGSQKRNIIFLFVLMLLWFTNLTFHLQQLGMPVLSRKFSLYFAIHLILVVVSIIAGRVIPFFTERALRSYERKAMHPYDVLANGSVFAFGLAYAINEAAPITTTLAVVAGVLATVRLIRWYDQRIWQIPILWILYLGYLWLPLGFLLNAMANAQLVNPSLALHAHTIGAIGVLIVGMVSRVSLGHTGRALYAPPLIVSSYILINLAALVRVAMPILWPEFYLETVLFSGILWMSAFACIVYVYTPILLSKRSDGKPY